MLFRSNEPAEFFFRQIFIVDTELLAIKDDQLFIPTALEIFDRFQIFFQFIGNGGLGRTLTVLFVSFPNIPDNEIEVIQNHVAEIFIIADMGGLQHFQMRVIFAGAIPFNEKTQCPDNAPAQTDLSAYEIVSE